MNNSTTLIWLAFPQNKPDDNCDADFVVLSPNPNIIKKALYQQNKPRYHAIQAIWTGTDFVNSSWQPMIVNYYIQLPPHPSATCHCEEHSDVAISATCHCPSSNPQLSNPKEKIKC